MGQEQDAKDTMKMLKDIERNTRKTATFALMNFLKTHGLTLEKDEFKTRQKEADAFLFTRRKL